MIPPSCFSEGVCIVFEFQRRNWVQWAVHVGSRCNVF
jgi:hypothetical protein